MQCKFATVLQTVIVEHVTPCAHADKAACRHLVTVTILGRCTLLCKAHTWACLQDTAKLGLQVATTEGAFKLQGPVTRGATQVCF